MQEERGDRIADTLIVSNQLHDEEIAISDSERHTKNSIKSSPSPTSPDNSSIPGASLAASDTAFANRSHVSTAPNMLLAVHAAIRVF